MHRPTAHRPPRGRDPLRSTNSDPELTLGETSRLRSGSAPFIRGAGESSHRGEAKTLLPVLVTEKQSWKRFIHSGMVWTRHCLPPASLCLAAPPNTPPQAQPKPAHRASLKRQPLKPKTRLSGSTKHWLGNSRVLVSCWGEHPAWASLVQVPEKKKQNFPVLSKPRDGEGIVRGFPHGRFTVSCCRLPALRAHRVSHAQFCVFFCPCSKACGILVSRSGLKPTPAALESWSLNHWTTRQVPSPAQLST